VLWLGQHSERIGERFSRALEGSTRSCCGQAAERGRRVERSLSAIETTEIEQAGDPARFLIDTMGRVKSPAAKKRKANSKASLKARRRVAATAKRKIASRVPAPTPARNASDIDDERAWMDFSH
jgi:hypothetical protein